MKSRMVMLKISLVAFIAAGLVLVVGLALGAAVTTANAAPDYPPEHTVQSYARYTLLTSNGLTSTTAGTGVVSAVGTGVRVAGYDYMDCYGNFDATASQTATLALEGSADGTNYAALSTFGTVSADTTVVTRTAILGEYFRARITTLGTANPITVTVKCVAKN